ncbi:putative baseplate assembly protein [Streptomyces tagetis]|uniref:Baseplate assembly protein n=1 Tax=Streptomyces tagetis TaxID=2820809 RepID=A0A941AXV5_9ACTN|nr:putative baseplate assembly protein [Streptomyces sp. RG38]MBQ0826644.1 putative baseplate assembly protein [Streptomyces sp. RG38]
MTVPIPPPALDDRSYDDLRSELLERIAVYTPEWTDRNPSDPGITLLELVAFLGEKLLYRFNQIPDATRAWLLRLLRVPLRPAHPARGMVAFTPVRRRADGTPDAVELPAATVVAAGSVQFETEQDVTALPVRVRAVAKTAAPAPTDHDDMAAVQAALDAYGLGDDEDPVFYRAVVLPDVPTVPGAQPLEVPNAVDGTLWLAVIADEAKDAGALRHGDSSLAGAELSLGVALDPQVPDMFAVEPCPGAGPAAGGPPPQVEWQISTIDREDGGEPRYETLQLFADSTGGLRRDGVVRLRLPRDLTRLGVPVPDAPDGVGVGAYPPALDGEEAVLFWLRAFPLAGAAEIPALRWVGVNAAEVVQAVTAQPEYLGTGTGMPDQRYAFAHRPVQPDVPPVVVEVEENGVWRPWQRVESFAASGPEDRHWTLDGDAGEGGFGDTVRGRAPQIGERVRVLRYRYGGGVQGNVAAGSLTRLPGGEPATVSNPLATEGGTEAETLDAALGRIPGEFRRHDRAVTASDFAELAALTPGGDVGRAECLPLFHPPTKALDAAGVVTVVVWPRHDAFHPDAPVPDRGLLRRVCAHLDARRPVTTELYVVPPAYRKVAVSVGLSVKPGHSADAARHWAELVLRQYLSPLPPYGPEGGGWPLGRRVHGPELEAAVLQVEGVEYLTGLDVAQRSDDGSWTLGTVELRPWEVAEPTAISEVAGGTPLPVGEQPSPPSAPGTPVPVPVPSEEC